MFKVHMMIVGLLALEDGSRIHHRKRSTTHVHFSRKVDVVQCQIRQATRTHQTKRQQGIRRQGCHALRLLLNVSAFHKGTHGHAQDFEVPQHDAELKAFNAHNGFLEVIMNAKKEKDTGGQYEELDRSRQLFETVIDAVDVAVVVVVVGVTSGG